MDIGHLSHPVYGAPELASALVDNPAEYLPIVSSHPPRRNLPLHGSSQNRCQQALTTQSFMRDEHITLRRVYAALVRRSVLCAAPGLAAASSRPLTMNPLHASACLPAPFCSLSRPPSRRASAFRT